MRAFLAFDIDSVVKAYLQEIIMSMTSRMRDVRWVKSESQHITLKFFGDIEEDKVKTIGEALAAVGTKFGPFEVTLRGINAFPSKKRARVIVVDLEKGVDIAKAIFHDIEVALSTLGIEGEKRGYIPHITLGRRKDPSPILERDLPAVKGMGFIVNGVVLYKSTLTPAGAIYTKVWELALRGERGMSGGAT